MPQVRDPKTGRYTSGGGSSVGGAASTNPRVQKAKAVGNGAPAGGSSSTGGKIRDWSNDTDFPKDISVDIVEKNGTNHYRIQTGDEKALDYSCDEYLWVEAKQAYVSAHGIEIDSFHSEDWEAFNFEGKTPELSEALREAEWLY